MEKELAVNYSILRWIRADYEWHSADDHEQNFDEFDRPVLPATFREGEGFYPD